MEFCPKRHAINFQNPAGEAFDDPGLGGTMLTNTTEIGTATLPRRRLTIPAPTDVSPSAPRRPPRFPALAWAALALLGLLAHPSPAAAQTDVWTATLTPADFGSGLLGCNNASATSKCSTATVLSDDDFTYDSTDYSVTTLYLNATAFTLTVDTDITAATNALTVVVGSTSLAFAAAIQDTARTRTWFNPGFSWTAGTAVSIRIPDTTPPELTSAAVAADGNSITVTFDESVDQTNLPAAGAFSVAADGAPVTVSGVSAGTAAQLVLALAAPGIRAGQVVTLGYTDPTAGDDTSAVQDTSGNDAVSFSDYSVTNNSIVVTVPSDWSLKPTGLAVGDQFRLLFLSSTKRDGSSTDIATYNTFIQTRAAAGHADIRTYSTGFRAVGCTADTDARDTTYTTYTSTDKGVPIYWLNGAKAADQYEDFYDGTWDDEANDKNESGTNGPNTSQQANYPLTGCNDRGTEYFDRFNRSSALAKIEVMVGRPNSSAAASHGPLSSNTALDVSNTVTRPMYGLSAIFQVAADTIPPTLTSADVEITDALIINLVFSEDLQLSNRPAVSAFTVTVDGSAATVSSVLVPGSVLPQNELWLQLSTAIRQRQAVVVTYTDATSGDDTAAIQDTAGNDAATFTTGMDGVPAVTNNSTVTNTVPADWSLIPTGLSTGDKFRLLFLSSTKRTASSTDIADYNTFIQTRAAAGHTDIQDYSADFRAVGCTAAVDARDNTATTYTTTDKGVPIYWLNGAKAADQYEDFYDGSWDDEANDKNESGTNGPDTSLRANYPWTGCDHDGTEAVTGSDSFALGTNIADARVGRPNSSGSGHGPLNGQTNRSDFNNNPLYGLSAVFQVAAAVVVPNNPPTVANAIPDQSATAGTAFSYVFPDTTFSDADTSDTLTYTATKADDTALPTWLAFAAGTRTFSGTPTAAETVSVKVTASDGNGGSVSDTFDITVAADTTPPTLTSAGVNEAGLFILLGFSENLQLSNLPPASAFTVTAGGSAVTVSGVLPRPGAPDVFVITVSPAIRQGQAIVVTYTDPTAGDDATAFQDTAGNDAATFTTGLNGVPAVTNSSTVTNNPPTVANTIPDQTATVGTAFSYVFPANTFSDADTSDTLSYTATKAADTALPLWLAFAASTRTFSGTPTAAGMVALKVTASDGNGGSVSDTFDITVAADTTPPTLTSAEVDVGEGMGVDFEFSENLQRSNPPPASAFTVTVDGSAATVSSVGVPGSLVPQNQLFLTVSPVITQGQAVVVSYTDPTASDDASAIQDVAGNDAASFTTGSDGVPAVINASIVVPAATEVPADWSLKPTAVTAGTQFRLLFLSSTKRNASSTDIADYNTFIQGLAAAGHADIQTYSTGFRAVGCTADTDARDNTYTTYTSTDKGVPIYWLNGAQAADEYEDFYDGSWDDEANDKNESGTNAHDTSQTDNYPWSGCNQDGTEALGGGGLSSRGLGSTSVRIARPNSSGSGSTPLSSIVQLSNTENHPLYGLSGVFQVAAAVVVPNNPPAFSADTAARSVAENTAAGQNVGAALTATDADTLTYTLEGTDAASFDIVSGSGQIQTRTGVTYNHEAKSTYTVVVKADDGNGGTDTVTVTIAVTDVDEPPGRPAAPTVSATAGSTTSLDVTWTAPTNTGPAIASYDLQYRAGTSGNFTNGPQNVTGTSAAIGSLAADTSYEVQVRATNAEGDGDWSVAGTGRTTATSAPGAPTGLTATASGSTAINLSWTAPGSTGGSAITGYKIESSSDGGSSWSDLVANTSNTTTTYAHTGLAAGDTRHYRVSAINANGAGDPSNVDSATTDATVPGAPTGLTATASGATAIDLSWAAPASTGGSAITGYKIEVSPNGTDTWTTHLADTTNTNTTYAHTGLAASTTRHYRVSAINTIGTSAASNVDDATTGAGTNTPATGAPTITGTAQVGQTLTAGTTAIMDAEGLTTPSYTYQWIRVATDNSETNIASATASTYTLVDADLGTTVKVRVSFTDDASNAETLTSNVSVIIARPANTAATGKPGITGTAQVGQTLTATVGTSADVDGLPNPFLTDVNTSFQWIRVATDNTETNIASATASTYTLVAADLGTTIKVKVGFVDYYDYDETLTSDATAAVAASTNTPATGAPTITGTAQVGQTLTAGTTAIMDADGLTSVSYTYQWIRVDGGTETNISGATASTYTLVAADQGKTIKVRVSFTDDASNAETLTSTATAVVSAAPNTLPSASDGTVTTNEDTARTFAAADFNFLDTDPGDTLSNVRIVTLPASGKGTLALSGTPVTANQVVAATNIGTLTYTPPANANGTGYASFTFKVSDGTAESAADYTMTITVTAVNDAPTVATAIPDQPATAGTAFSYAFPANTFSDADTGDTLTYAATKADGATLPAWLSFAAGTRTFSGTPQAADVGTVAVKVTASDGNGGSVSDTFDITVSAAGDTTPPTLTSATVFEGGVFINLQFSENMLQSNLPSTTTFTVTAAGSAVTVYTVQPAVFPATPPNAFWILVRPTIQQGQVVVVTYTDPTAGDDGNAIQNTAGNDAATFTTGMDGVPAVTNNSITNTPATGAPTITGTAQVGQTLTAGTTAIMDADGLTSVSYTYQWIRTAAGVDTNISEATASTHTLVAADQGKTIKVTVSFTDDASNAETLTSAATAAVSAAANTPATGAPTITGTAQVGQTLTAGTTAIMDANGLTSVSYTYQWIRVATDNTETNIASATASTYTLVAADQGTTIKVTVSFTDDASNAETLTSAATAAVSAAANTPATGAPTITGTAQVGQTLTAGTTAIMDADGLTSVSYTYQWIRVATDNTETNIASATASTYTLVAADQGTTIKVKVSFTDDASNAETLTSAATAAVSAAANTPATGAPTITGTAQVGQTLTADTTAIVDADGLTNVSYTYQWIRVATDNTETNIASATASTYTLVAADQGKTIKVKVSFTDDASNAETLTSAATAAVSAAANTPATGAPTITGTAQVGQTLTAGTTAIMDANGLTSVSYTYQWIRVATDNTETNIASATASTYTLVAADQGTTIKVKVSFTDDASNPETRTSAATAAVSAAANTPATGAPTITGTAQVGQTLTAVTTAIMDANGLTSVSYTYQWIRVATDNTETNISSATASTYTLVAADQGTTIKVTVSFTDDASNPETLHQRGDGGRLGGGQHPRDGRADDHRHGDGRADADGGHHRHHGCRRADRGAGDRPLQVPVDPGGHRQQRDEHLLGDGEHLHAGGGRPGHDDQGEGELHRRRQQRRDADQRGDGGRLGGGQHPRDGRADDHRHGAGRADADGLDHGYCRRQRADHPQLHVPVDPGGRHGGRHCGREFKHLHPGRRRPGHDPQGAGELHRRRQQFRDAHQRGDGNGGRAWRRRWRWGRHWRRWRRWR